jgi:hypothetical protein
VTLSLPVALAVHLTLAGDPDVNAGATLHAGFTTVLDLGSAEGAGLRLRDTIAIEGDPLADLHTVQRPAMVFMAGRPVA